MVVFLHITHGIDADEAAHESNNYAHEHGQAVNLHVGRFGKFRAAFHPGHQTGLDDGQQGDGVFFVADT